MLCTGLWLSVSLRISNTVYHAYRKQLAEVIKTHNEKVFGQLENEIVGSAEDISEDITVTQVRFLKDSS